MTKSERAAWLGLLVLGVVGCGSSETPVAADDTGSLVDAVGDGPSDTTADAVTDSGADAAGSDTSAGDTSTSDTAGACNALANAADVVTTQQVAEALPSLKGGSVAEGTYVVTAVTAYTGPGATGPKTGTTMQQTMRLAAGAFDIVRVQNGGAEKRSSGAYSTSGSAFTLGGTCPTTSSVPVEYDATATTLRISLGSTIKEILTYTKK
ncbi:MAG: hypothetical protein IPJ34_34325 [Myxococcales bacterium]|nr:hypothetical protein [Myxococcales bacterium]